MDIIPIGPGFAAELRGVALADVAADDEAYRRTRAAFEEHSVLVFRDQDVTDESQLAFSRRFGPLEVTHVAAEGAGTNLVILSTIDKDGNVVPADHRLALRNKANQLWHTDSTFKSRPALASVLSGRIMPAQGGETEYVSTRLAWERLDRATQEKLASFFVWHDYSHSRGKISPNLVGASERAALPPLIGAHTRGMFDVLRSSSVTGEQPWARLYAEGHGDYWGPAADYIDRHLDDWASALLK